MYDTATRVELVKKRVRELNGACVRRNITGTKIRIGVYIGGTDNKYAFINSGRHGCVDVRGVHGRSRRKRRHGKNLR